jgi:hypothetical protein
MRCLKNKKSSLQRDVYSGLLRIVLEQFRTITSVNRTKAVASRGEELVRCRTVIGNEPTKWNLNMWEETTQESWMYMEDNIKTVVYLVVELIWG